MRNILCGIFSFLLPLTIFGQETTDKFDKFIQEVLADHKEIPSITVAISKDGKPFYLNSFGYTAVNLQQKANSKSAYYIASVTKSFVGILASTLHEDGLIDLNKPITAYAPIKHFQDKSVFEGVTITDLLSHTSGIKNTLLTWQFADIGNYDRELLIKILETKTTSLHNNKGYRYDNLGYNIFDLILSEEFNLSWKDLLRDRIFAPLKMKHTTASVEYAIGSKWQLAQPYTAINAKRIPTIASTVKNEATFQAAGGMVASSADMQKFLSEILRSIKGKGTIQTNVLNRVFNSNASNTRKSTFIDNNGYGLGWNIGVYREQKVYYHLGGFDGYFAHLSVMPEANIGVAIMVNESHFGDNVGNLIANYIYDNFISTNDLDKKFEEEKEKVANRIDRIQKAFEGDRQARSSRTYTLYHSLDLYNGIYSNKYLGKLMLTTNDKQEIQAQLGILNAVASPSANDDSIRVEFRDGSGRDILFISNEKEVLAAVYQGYVFLKQ